MPNIQAAERERVERKHAREQAKLDLVARAEYVDPERRTLVYRRVEYVVTWNGSLPPRKVAPVQPSADEPCECGCGLMVTPPIRFASQACVGRHFRGRPTEERVPRIERRA